MHDIIIIGAGPAGLTSAIYGRRAEKKVLVLESKSYGGQIINTLDIENYPAKPHVSGYEFATDLYNQAKDLGAEFIFEEVTEIKDYNEYKEVFTNKNSYKTKTIVIATGADVRKLDLELENELVGKGVSYCATCDGGFYKDKVVAIQGGGNTALEDALYLSSLAKKVYLIHRSEIFKADQSVVNKVREKNNVEIILNSSVTKLIANEKLESIEVSSNGETINLDVDGLFIAIGRVPSNNCFSNLIGLDKNGYIISNEDCKTNIDGIYVAGDVRNKKLRQLVTAVSDGAIAATNAVNKID